MPHISHDTHSTCCSSIVSLSLLEGKSLGRGSFLGSQDILWGPSAPGWPPMVRVPLPGAGSVLGGCRECIGGRTGALQGCSWWAGECSSPGVPPHTPALSNQRHGASPELELSCGVQGDGGGSITPMGTATQPQPCVHCVSSRGCYMNKVQKRPKPPCFPLPQAELS